MAFTYDGDPSASDVDAVRWEISDTDPNAPLLQDAEVAFAILQETGLIANDSAVSLVDVQIFTASARCMETLARKFAMQADQEIGDTQTTYSKMAAGYADRAKGLRVKAQGSYAPSSMLFHSDKHALDSDTDLVHPTFRRGQFRNPETGSGAFDDCDLPICDTPLDG